MERIRRFFRKLGKGLKAGLKAKGFTLMEVAAVVAVSATLSAVALPTIIDKIKDAKIQKATEDVNGIRTAVFSFVKDMGVPPFYRTASAIGTPPIESKMGVNDLIAVLVSVDGVNPDISRVNGAGAWTLPSITSGTTLSETIDGQLIYNNPSYSTTHQETPWKGPYMPFVRKDPWGQKYLVTVKWFAEDDNLAVVSRTEKAIFVISAGPNGLIETSFSQPVKGIGAADFVAVGDDIISRIK